MFNDFKYDNNLTVTGLNSSLINEYILNYHENNDRNILVVTDSLYNANNIYKGIHKLTNDVYFLFGYRLNHCLGLNDELYLHHLIKKKNRHCDTAQKESGTICTV